MIGYYDKGAGKSSKQDYYSNHINCLAYLDTYNNLIEKEITLFYFLQDTKPLRFLDLQNLTPYDFVVKKLKDKNFYYIIELKGKSNTNKFDPIIQEQSKPLTIIEKDYIFKFDRNFKWYEGKVFLGNKFANVFLYPKRNTTDATESLKVLNEIKNEFLNFFHNVLLQCSKNLVGLANEWQDDNTHLITIEEIYKRIDCDFFDMEIRDNKYTIYLDDDDLFLGHTIVYKGNIENNEFNVTIAG